MGADNGPGKASGPREAFIPNPKLKLLEQVSEVMRLKHYSLRTEVTYREWIKRYICFHGKRHPRELGRAEVERFLSDLAVRRKVAASTQNQAFNALRFLYREVLHQELGQLGEVERAKRPARLPVVLTRAVRTECEYSAKRRLVSTLQRVCGARRQEHPKGWTPNPGWPNLYLPFGPADLQVPMPMALPSATPYPHWSLSVTSP